MKLKCECGQEFEAPEGTKGARCPRCRREVKAAVADWLDSLDTDGLSLEGEEVRKAEAPTAPPKPTAAGTEGEAADAGTQAAPRAARPSAPLPGARAPQGRRVGEDLRALLETKVKEPEGVVQMALMARDEPVGAMAVFRKGVKKRRFLIELAAPYLVLAVVWALVQPRLAHEPEVRAISAIVAELVGLLTSSLVLAMLAYLLKRGSGEWPSPLGVLEGMALMRVLGLLVATPLGVVFALLVPGVSGPATGALTTVARYVPWVYTVVVFCAQSAFVMGLLELGCLPGVILSALLAFAGTSMAEKVIHFI